MKYRLFYNKIAWNAMDGIPPIEPANNFIYWMNWWIIVFQVI
jgi:hypothetical protein